VGFLPGLLSIGFRAGGFRGRFRGHVGLSFVGSRAAGLGRGVVRWRSLDLSSTGWRRLTVAQSPISDLLIGLSRLAPISQIQDSTGTAWRETGRKNSKGIGQVGMKSEGLTSGTQGGGHRRSHFEIGGDNPCSQHLSKNAAE
jgi:hypothetical protein